MNAQACMVLVVMVLSALIPSVRGADEVLTNFRRAGQAGEVDIHARLKMPVSAMTAEYTILRSTNLSTWEPLGAPFKGGAGVSDEFLRQPVPIQGDRGFYRVMANVVMSDDGAKLGDAIYGYGTEFSRQLQAIGQLALPEFAAAYPIDGQYLAQLTFSPTDAEYWEGFSTNAGFQLDATELAIFQTNAFVVSQRLGSYSFANSFYKIFSADLPVYVSPDAVLHAWHRSCLNMLEEIEESCLSPALEQVLQGMNGQVTALNAQAGAAMVNGVRDADYFIAVARSLLTGTTQGGNLGQGAEVLATLTAISNLAPATVSIFGTNREIDFSQFTVRGHYETSPRLAKYFKAMMWCGLADYRFTGATNDNSLRELSGAAAMHFLLQNSGQFGKWKQLDDVIQMFVGAPDGLTFAQLGDVLAGAGVQSIADLSTQAALLNLHSNIMSGAAGVQNIQSGYFWSPLTQEQIKLPRSFSVSPTRFTVDGWAMNQCVFDRIIWDEDGVPDFFDKVMRRVPSALDVAFSVIGNNHAVPLIVDRILNTAGHSWRDGCPYQHNLAAVRTVLDAQEPLAWTSSIYQSWLGCLRELSGSTTGPEYPDAMRTLAWAMKTLNAQLASWSELRHDTVLYAKQPYTGNVLCSYPDGFVEPRVGFWQRMGEMSARARELFLGLPKTGQFVFEPSGPGTSWITNSLGTIYTNRIQFLERFGVTMSMLGEISSAELARRPLSSNQVYFIQGLIESPTGYVETPRYNGWYPGLYFENTRGTFSGMYSAVDLWDPMVVDVHTDPLDLVVGDPGSTLHEAVGNVAMLMVAVNWGSGDACVYAGPVLTHYEFELGPSVRKTDSEWRTEIRAGNFPPIPQWTSGYQVQGNITYPWWWH